MQTILYTIHPNDLETLMIEAEQLDDVLHSPFLKDKEVFDVIGQHLASLLNNISTDSHHQTISYSMQGEYPLSERLHPANTVHYNPVVQVVEIHQALDAISVAQFKQQVITAEPSIYSSAELVLDFQQLQSFYQDAARQNLAVISVVAPDLIAKKVI